MHTDGSSLVLLKTCGDPVEASAVRSLLDANGIYCVVQGENHRQMLGVVMGGAVIEMRVLVPEQELERAQAVLAAEVVPPQAPVSANVAPGGVDSEEAVCPVHGERSTAVCSRCGTFLCASCGVTASAPALCEDCVERQSLATPARWSGQYKVLAVLALVLVVLFGLVLL